ncbi:hypothetical protein CERSUDRAFT_97259 [Gelatoporia subvermispora B]|uniref:protein-histidine N-methyltransferase n=1 Tax=Ceriporiopsis subvermispora (strain B) TaxID=914234 RepID=M2QCC4_CERS8|nr:hypothetical protein CERSUDRAFT_97259 [Gelatoporia subvermispora B]
MFKFNFDADDDLDAELPFEVTTTQSSTGESKPSKTPETLKHFKEIPVCDLFSNLPPAISYSPLAISTSSGSHVALSRRDLFDARFQLISGEGAEEDDGSEDKPPALEFVDAPSDLVPGVYEGGLKTWECSLDLVDCLDKTYEGNVSERLKGKRVIELGCGTAVPTMYLLKELLSTASHDSANVQLHLQDYNDLVFQLVTVFNLLLTWYMSPASQAFRDNVDSSPAGDQQDPPPPADATIPGELPLSPELIGAFQESLKLRGIDIRFFSGSWDTFDLHHTGGKYDVVLTSETIYRPESLPSLLNLMCQACVGDVSMSHTSDISNSPARALEDITAEQLTIAESTTPYLCLVAAKLVYFGVGGGISEFVRAVEHPEDKDQAPCHQRKGSVQHLWERNEGVKRTIMRVTWL